MWARAVVPGLSAAVLALVVSACTPPSTSHASSAPLLAVTNSLDGTVTQIDSATGHTAGLPLPPGVVPWQVPAGQESQLRVPTARRRCTGGRSHLRRP